jgi:hypothetical protein
MSLGKKKQEILDSLYDHCSCRTNRSKDVLQKLLDDVKIYPGNTGKEKLLAIIREYKATGKNLESTVNLIYDVLYPVKTGTTSINTNEYKW